MRWFRPPPMASSRPPFRGGRSSILAAALCALALAWWLSGTRREPGEGTAAFPLPVDLAGDEVRGLASIEEPSGEERARAVGSLPAGTPAEPSTDGELVDVCGRVLAGGLPVAEREIELVPLAGTRARPAWDLTDDEGLYAVQLEPGSYGVLLDGVLAPGARLEVPLGVQQVRSNVTLASLPLAD